MLQGPVELQLLVNSQGAGTSPCAPTDGWQGGGDGTGTFAVVTCSHQC